MNIAEKITRAKADFDEVYTAGYTKGQSEGGGYDEGYAEGIEQGKQAEYDAFWNTYLRNGDRKILNYAFAGIGWTDETFKPNCNLIANEANYMFHSSRISNLVEASANLGITIDFSQCTTFTYAFGACYITAVGVIDVRSCKSILQYLFYNNPNIRTVEKMIVNENNTFSNTNFGGANNLREIRIEGTVASNGLSFSPCKYLSHDSLISILNALKDYSSDTSGTEWKVTVGSANIEKLTDEELAIAYRKGWTVA